MLLAQLHAAPLVTRPQSPRLESPSTTALRLLHVPRDARQIIRLVQCHVCSRPLRQPRTLTCGHSLCRQCVPPLYVRHNISWLNNCRTLGFKCPFADCGKEQVPEDCARDITLAKVVATIKAAFEAHLPAVKPYVVTQMAIQAGLDVASVSSPGQRQTRHESMPGTTMLATYALAEKGKLKYDDEVTYSSTGLPAGEVAQLDEAVFEGLKKDLMMEMDCPICAGLYLDPLTTECGHTFCRGCLRRSLNSTRACPLCRQQLSPQPVASARRICSMIDGFWADSAAARPQAVHRQQQLASTHEREPGSGTVAILGHFPTFPSQEAFINVLGQPLNLTALIRAMLRGDALGTVSLPSVFSMRPEQHTEIGTLVHVTTQTPIVDGQVRLQGVSRFRFVRYSFGEGGEDDYVVAVTQHIHDISISEEEAMEVAETMEVRGVTYFTTRPGPHGPIHPPSPVRLTINKHLLHTLSSCELYHCGILLFLRLRHECEVFFEDPQPTTLYLTFPDTYDEFNEWDEPQPCAKELPWLVAAWMMMPMAEAYAMLRSTSVRQRLKIAVYWLLAVEAGRIRACGSPSNSETSASDEHNLPSASSAAPAPEP